MAIGARLHAEIADSSGNLRSIYRTIGNNSSFGGNTLVESLGLLDSSVVKKLTVTWPTGQTTQVFHDIPADQTLLITEGVDAFQTAKPSPKPAVGKP